MWKDSFRPGLRHDFQQAGGMHTFLGYYQAPDDAL